MAKDYYRGKPAPPSPPSTPPIRRKPSRSCIGWLVGGVALGVVGSNFLAPRSGPSEDDAVSVQPEPPVLKPTFTYEKILSETEVDVSKLPPLPPPAPRPQPLVLTPEPPPQTVATTNSQPEVWSEPTLPFEPAPEPEPPPAAEPQVPNPFPASTEPRSGTYVVQVASFSRPADAERLRERLALIGLSTNIQIATLPSGKTAYRVRTGAYASRQDAEQARELLKQQGQDGMTIPIK